MKYLKINIKILIAIFFGLSLMALAGDPVLPDGSNQIIVSTYQEAH